MTDIHIEFKTKTVEGHFSMNHYSAIKTWYLPLNTLVAKALRFLLLGAFVMLASCDANRVIINNVDEREANEIVVLLASKGIVADKMVQVGNSPGADNTQLRFSISVGENESTSAMAFLNQNGLPRVQGTSLLNLFARQGLMSSQQEEMIRFQAGLSEQIANTIRRIDGVIDAQVQIAFPSSDANVGVVPGANAVQKITAAVYVKHQGVLDDPNSHLVTKIKRLVASSVSGLELNDVTVIADRARFMDITLSPLGEPMMSNAEAEYISIWSIVMTKASAARFRVLFFGLLFISLILAVIVCWILWKFYPVLRHKGGLKELLQPAPIDLEEKNNNPPPPEEQGL